MVEFTKVQKIEALVREWDTQKGHEACWYYPEIFRQIAEVLEIKLENPNPDIPKCQFQAGCYRFTEEKYSGD